MLPSRVLITGGTGFIGQRMVAALLARGTQVVAVHRRTDTSALPLLPGLTWSRADDDQITVAHPPDAVVHLATCYGATESNAEVVETNVAFPLRLMQGAANTDCRLFLNTDTFFGKAAFDYPHMRSYIDSKNRFADIAAELASRTGTLRLIDCRLEHVYGPNDGKRKFVTLVLEKLLMNEPLALTAGNQERDFVYVDDVIEAYLLLLGDRQPRVSNTQTLEIGTGVASSVRTFVETAKRLSGSRSVLDFGALKHREGEIMRSIADTSGLMRLGWCPRHDIETGLCETLAVMRRPLSAGNVPHDEAAR